MEVLLGCQQIYTGGPGVQQAEHPGLGLTGANPAISTFNTTGGVGLMLLQFTPDPAVNKRGFKASYSVGGCPVVGFQVSYLGMMKCGV